MSPAHVIPDRGEPVQPDVLVAERELARLVSCI